MEGGSVGFQIGGSETDVVMLVMNERGAQKLMESQFTLGGEGEVAAGPVVPAPDGAGHEEEPEADHRRQHHRGAVVSRLVGVEEAGHRLGAEVGVLGRVGGSRPAAVGR